MKSFLSLAALKAKGRAVAIKRERNLLIDEVAELKRKLAEVEGERNALRERVVDLLSRLDAVKSQRDALIDKAQRLVDLLIAEPFDEVQEFLDLCTVLENISTPQRDALRELNAEMLSALKDLSEVVTLGGDAFAPANIFARQTIEKAEKFNSPEK